VGEVPGQDSFRFGYVRNLGEMFAAEPLTNFGKSGPLRVRESEPRRKVRAQDSILGDQVFAWQNQALVDQPCDVRKQARPFVVLYDKSTLYRSHSNPLQRMFLTIPESSAEAKGSMTCSWRWFIRPAAATSTTKTRGYS
jgi:hypothetical protein